MISDELCTIMRENTLQFDFIQWKSKEKEKDVYAPHQTREEWISIRYIIKN